MSTLLTLQNLSLHYPHKVIFKDVTFTLNQGDKIGVLGLNGHGKSSLFKTIAGQEGHEPKNVEKNEKCGKTIAEQRMLNCVPLITDTPKNA